MARLSPTCWCRRARAGAVRTFPAMGGALPSSSATIRRQGTGLRHPADLTAICTWLMAETDTVFVPQRPCVACRAPREAVVADPGIICASRARSGGRHARNSTPTGPRPTPIGRMPGAACRRHADPIICHPEDGHHDHDHASPRYAGGGGPCSMTCSLAGDDRRHRAGADRRSAGLLPSSGGAWPIFGDTMAHSALLGVAIPFSCFPST